MSDISTADQIDSDTAFKDRLEQLIAIMLGLAAVITAWTAYQGNELGDSVQKSYSQGIRLFDNASQEFNRAIAIENQDELLFVEYTKSLISHDDTTASYIHETLMSPDLAKAVDWWLDQPEESAPDSPFVDENPEWTDEALVSAKAIDEEAQQSFDNAEKSDTEGDKFALLEVIVTLSLFLFGVASLVRQQRIQVALAGVGALILIYSIIMTISLGDPAGLF
jgi:hypothetical protein